MKYLIGASAPIVLACACGDAAVSTPGAGGTPNTSASSSSTSGSGGAAGEGGSGGWGGDDPVVHRSTSTVIDTGGSPSQIACLDGRLFWVVAETGDLMRSDLDGAKPTILSSGNAVGAIGMLAYAKVIHVAIKDPGEVRWFSEDAAPQFGHVADMPGVIAYRSHADVNGLAFWSDSLAIHKDSVSFESTESVALAIDVNATGVQWVDSAGDAFFKDLFPGSLRSIGTALGNVHPNGLMAARDSIYAATSTGLHRRGIHQEAVGDIDGVAVFVADRGNDVVWVSRGNSHDTVIASSYDLSTQLVIDDTETVTALAACGNDVYWGTVDGTIWTSSVH